jgi:hypothetical protein
MVTLKPKAGPENSQEMTVLLAFLKFALKLNTKLLTFSQLWP